MRPTYYNSWLFLQYYYNPHTQQFMYWEGEKHTYIPAASGQSNTEGDCAAPADSVLANLGSKEKKDKPKSKTAQQVHFYTKMNSRHDFFCFVNN